MTRLEDRSSAAKKVGRPSVAAAARIETSILDAATSIFMQHGSRATMNEIVEASGLSRKAVYARFESKQVLFRAVIQRLFDPRANIELQFTTSDNLGETLCRFVEACFREATTPESIALRSLINADPDTVEEILPTVMSGLERRYVEPLQNWLLDQRQKGNVRLIDIPRTANMIVSITLAEANRIADRKSGGTSDDNDPSFSVFLSDLFVTGLAVDGRS